MRKLAKLLVLGACVMAGWTLGGCDSCGSSSSSYYDTYEPVSPRSTASVTEERYRYDYGYDTYGGYYYYKPSPEDRNRPYHFNLEREGYEDNVVPRGSVGAGN